MAEKAINESNLREHYEPTVYLSLMIKGVKPNEDQSEYKIIFLNKQL